MNKLELKELILNHKNISKTMVGYIKSRKYYTIEMWRILESMENS